MVTEVKDDLTDRTPDQPFWDSQLHGTVVKWSDEWVVIVLPMIFNDRVVLSTREDYKRMYEAGWCFDQGNIALAAAIMWDPDTQDEPQGYKKVAAKRDRRYV